MATGQRTHTAKPVYINREAQHERFGGFNIGSAIFGWLVATGISAIIASILAAAGSAIALSKVDEATSGSLKTIGIVGGILLLITLAIAYYAGGYVAGRMSRFDGARQGFGVWIIGIVITIILAAAGAILGSKYNVLQTLNLPHLPIKGSSFTTGGLITSLLSLLVTLAAALGGGKAGEAYHRRIDEASMAER
jgi:hypothetical protein